MHPVSWLRAIRSSRSLLRPASSIGIAPVRRLSRSLSSVMLVRLPSSVGIAPVRRLLSRYSRFTLVRLPSSTGIVPVSRLSGEPEVPNLRQVAEFRRYCSCQFIVSENTTPLRSAKLPSHAGIVPDIRLFQRLSRLQFSQILQLCRYRSCQLAFHPGWGRRGLGCVSSVRRPNSDGIAPVNRFPPKCQGTQLGQITELGGYRPSQLVVAKIEGPSDSSDCPTVGRYRAGQIIVPERQTFEIG